MKLNKFQIGNRIRIVCLKELEIVLQCYSHLYLCEGIDLLKVAGQAATICEVSDANDTSIPWDGTLVVLLNDGTPLQIPFAAIADDSESINDIKIDFAEPVIVRDKTSEISMIRMLAAETIQDCYRRYRACKQFVKFRNIYSFEKVALSFAADTIKNCFKRVRAKRAQLITQQSTIEHQYMSFANLQTAELPNVTWNGKNDVYVIVSMENDDWSFRTTTIQGAGCTCCWADLTIGCRLNEKLSTKFQFDVYHENLARQDILIGSTGYRSIDRPNHTSEQCLEIFGLVKGLRSPRGFVKFVACAQTQFPCSTASIEELDSKSVTSELMTVANNSTISVATPTTTTILRSQIQTSISQTPSRGATQLFSRQQLQSANKKLIMAETVTPSKSHGQREHTASNDDNSNNTWQNSTMISGPDYSPDSNASSSLQDSVASGSKSASHTSSRLRQAIQKADEIQSQATTSNPIVAKHQTKKNRESSVARKKESRRDDSTSRRSFVAEKQLTLARCSSFQSNFKKLFIDEVFATAKSLTCSTIKMTVPEVSMILDALGYDVNVSSSADDQHFLKCIDIPLLNSAPLAAALTSFVRQRDLPCSSANFSISEKNAEIALFQLNSLIEGPWISAARQVILCETKNTTTSCRPFRWTSIQLQKLLKPLQLANSILRNYGGQEFLTLANDTFRCDLGITSSIMRTRLCLYLRILEQIDNCWDRGKRPLDSSSELVAAPVLTRQNSGGSRPSIDDNKNPRSGTEPMSGKSQSNNSSEWGIISIVKSSQPRNVEIRSCDWLLSSWCSLNRAFGWGLSLDNMSYIATRIAGLSGTLICREDKGEITTPKGCVWVSLTLDNFLDDISGLVAFDAPPMRIIFNKHVDSFQALLPMNCLREAKTSCSRTKHDISDNCVSADSLFLGQILRVVNLEQLSRTYERFDWWDRPDQRLLTKLAGSKCEIISLTELCSRNRVGVRLLECDIYDAVPIEALQLYISQKSSKGKANKKKKAAGMISKPARSARGTSIEKETPSNNQASRQKQKLRETLRKASTSHVRLSDGSDDSASEDDVSTARDTNLSKLATQLSIQALDSIQAIPECLPSQPKPPNRPVYDDADDMCELLPCAPDCCDQPKTSIAKASMKSTSRSQIHSNKANTTAAIAVALLDSQKDDAKDPEEDEDNDYDDDVPESNYGWLRPNKPLNFDLHVVVPVSTIDVQVRQSNKLDSAKRLSGGQYSASPHPVNFISPEFDANHAQYTEGVHVHVNRPGSANSAAGGRPKSANVKKSGRVQQYKLDSAVNNDDPLPVSVHDAALGLSGHAYNSNNCNKSVPRWATNTDTSSHTVTAQIPDRPSKRLTVIKSSDPLPSAPIIDPMKLYVSTMQDIARQEEVAAQDGCKSTFKNPVHVNGANTADNNIKRTGALIGRSKPKPLAAFLPGQDKNGPSRVTQNTITLQDQTYTHCDKIAISVDNYLNVKKVIV